MCPLSRVLLVAALVPSTACISVDLGGKNNGSNSSGGVDAAPAENVIGTAAPLAYAATLAMAALDGSSTPCASVTTGCSAYPCSSVAVDVSVGSGCNLPIGPDSATGTVPVTGTMSGPDNDSLIAVFQDINVNGSNVIFRRGAFTTTRNGDILTMAYGDQGIETTESNVKVSQAGWTVKVDTNGTPGDTSDDTLTIDGAEQIVINASESTVALANTVLSPDCTKNPTSGTATIQAVGTSAGGVTTLQFHSACDGKADVMASVSTGSIAVNSTVSLNLFR